MAAVIGPGSTMITDVAPESLIFWIRGSQLLSVGSLSSVPTMLIPLAFAYSLIPAATQSPLPCVFSPTWKTLSALPSFCSHCSSWMALCRGPALTGAMLLEWKQA